MQSNMQGLGEKEEGESGWPQRFEHLYGQTVVISVGNRKSRKGRQWREGIMNSAGL